MEWNKDNTLLFIQLIRERPEIWDASSSNYKIKNKKNDAIEEISTIFNISIKEVYNKWLSLRGQYYREKKKATGLKTGSGADNIYTPRWFAYHEMASLMSCNTAQNSVSNLEDSEIQSISVCMPTPPPATPTPPPTTPTPPPMTPTPPPPPPPSSRLSAKSSSKRNRNSGLYSEALQTLKAIKDRKNKVPEVEDDITAYGLYIAAQLRKFHPHLQSKAKLKIQTLLYKYEIENYDYRSDFSISDYSDWQNPQSRVINDFNSALYDSNDSDLIANTSTYYRRPDSQPDPDPSTSPAYYEQPESQPVQTLNPVPSTSSAYYEQLDSRAVHTSVPVTSASTYRRPDSLPSEVVLISNHDTVIESPQPEPSVLILKDEILYPANSKIKSKEMETKKAIEYLIQFKNQ